MGLKYTDPLIGEFFSINILGKVLEICNNVEKVTDECIA